MNTDTCLYRAFNNEGVLLYVGISECWARRWKQHRTEEPWYFEIAHLEVTWFASRAEALAAEKKAIRTEYSRFNSAGQPHDSIVNEQIAERLAARNAAE